MTAHQHSPASAASDSPDSLAYDVAVIGGGVAGLAAALMLGRARCRVLVLDAGAPRNRFAGHMHGVLGHDGQSPLEYLAEGREELAQYDVTVETGTVEAVTDVVRGLKVTRTDGTVDHARAVLVASGIDDELPDIPGLAEHWGGAAFQCPYCHGWEVRDRHIGVLATSPDAFHYATLVRNWTDRVTVFVDRPELLDGVDEMMRRRLDALDIRVVDERPVRVASSDDGALTGVETADGTVHPVEAIGLAPVPHPRDGFLAPLALERTELPMFPGAGTFLRVDAVGSTSHPRVWAVGNVVDPRLNVPASTGQAGMTAGMLNMTLVREDGDQAVAAAVSSHHDEWPEVAEDGFWEKTYADAPVRWSGRPNGALVSVLSEIHVPDAGSAAGRAADLGCGEGADVVWLAQQGWDTTGVEVSATAARRAQDAAAVAGVTDSVTVTDAGVLGLLESAGPESFGLVTASYLHAPSQDRRESLLASAGDLVAPGGYLFVLSHVLEGEETPAFDAENWTTVRDETLERTVIAPGGVVTSMPDRVLLLQKR